uniref:Protein FAR-RED ELONGATED HYPOCOTYL 3 n=1 Tax=Zeugodacus cucurbitae TaxID=28588 RepID=A0A0A1WKV2_ZEUCU
MTMDFNFLLIYIFLFVSGLICVFLGCMFRKGEPRKRFDKRKRRFGLAFWRSKPENRYKWADSRDEAARLAKKPPSAVPDLEVINLYLKEPIKLTEEERQSSKVPEAVLQAERELIMKRKAMRDPSPHTRQYKIQVEAEVETHRRRNVDLNPKPEPKVKFQKKFTTRAPQRRREDIELRGDTIEVAREKDIGYHIV